MPQILVINVKYVLPLDYFEIDEIEVFVEITPSTFNIANVPRGLSCVHWQQMGRVRKHPVHQLQDAWSVLTGDWSSIVYS